MSRYAAISVCLLAGSASLAAMDVADLRFGFGVAPMPDEQSGTFTANDGSGATMGVDIDYAGRSGGTLVISGTVGSLEPFGVLFGAEGRYSNGEAGINEMRLDGTPFPLDTVPESRYSESAMALHAGIGWAVTPSSHIELLALVGYSWLTIDAPANISTSNQTTNSGRGSGPLVGARLGFFTTLASQWQLGAQVEWTRTTADITTHYLDGTLETTMETVGPGARAVLGYRF